MTASIGAPIGTYPFALTFFWQLPESLGDLQLLEFLDVSHNQLSGPLPCSLSQLTKLQELHVEANQLTGGWVAGWVVLID